jgi:carboxyl-terminal processing protease
VQAIVLDLRDNSGGSLSSAVAVCRMLLPAGKPIVETRGRHGVLMERYSTSGQGAFAAMPVAVIINQNSASAAEILAAALQDNHRSVVVGQRSFGKGTVQQLLPLGESLLKLTWANFWRPSGANINRSAAGSEHESWGVSPDAGYEELLSPSEYDQYRRYRDIRDEVESDDAAANDGSVEFDDRPLESAVRYLRAQLEKSR